jgi:hypothetical protein
VTSRPDRPGRAIGHAAVRLALGYSLAMAAPSLWGSWSGDGVSIVGALIAATWSAAPAYGAALFAIASATRAGSALFLGAELLVITWFAWTVVDLSILHPSSTGAIAYFTLPLVQWTALILVAGVAALLGWRARDNWPDPPAEEVAPESDLPPVVHR